MAESSTIEWTDATWNPITGCTMVSAGCSQCYAARLAGGRLREHWSRKGLTEDTPHGPVWNGRLRFNEDWLHQPLRWRRPRRIFVCAHSDLFHEDVNQEWIDRIWTVMLQADHHTYQILTKRPERMKQYVEARFSATGRIPRHIWLGTSAEDQETAVLRIPPLLETPGAVFFVSLEPLLGPIDLHAILPHDAEHSALRETRGQCGYWRESLDWVIVGGESGPRARPMALTWARRLRDQCADAGVPFHFKQWGEWGEWRQLGATSIHWAPDTPGIAWLICDGAPMFSGRGFPTLGADGGYYVRVGRKLAGRELDGRTWDGYPREMT